ncbi:MAG: hypothetical protein AAGC60_11990 [Acidobacteriota bacterium]
MKRWWLVVALLLSVGLNVGLLAGRIAGELDRRVDGQVDESGWMTESEDPIPADPIPADPILDDVDPRTADASGLPAESADGATTAPGPSGEEPNVEQTSHESPRADTLPPPLERRLQRLVTRMADDLRLEGAQRARFEEIQMRFFRRSVAARFDGRRLDRRLRRELGSAHPERRRAELLFERTITRQAEVESAFLDAYFETHALLDAERFDRYRRILVRMRRMRDEIGRRLDASRRPPSAVESENAAERGP